jgi:hypothetical protein
VKEKPQICQKYFLTEVNIVELDTRDRHCNEMQVGFNWNFTEGTSKELSYLNSPYVYNFLMTTIKSIKKKEGSSIEKFSPRKKEESKSDAAKATLEQPNNGRELFFSNVLMKVYQVPSVFHRNSEEEIDDQLSSFIVLFYEKNMRKRTFAKS